jgi:hypothetical protein
MNTSNNSMDEMWFNYLLKCYNNWNYFLIICQFWEETCVKQRRQELTLWRETRLRRHHIASIDRRPNVAFRRKHFARKLVGANLALTHQTRFFFGHLEKLFFRVKKKWKTEKNCHQRRSKTSHGFLVTASTAERHAVKIEITIWSKI